MRIYLTIITVLLSLAFAMESKMPTNETNILGRFREVSTINYVTFSQADTLFDENKDSAATITPTQNGVMLTLRHPFYIREIKVYTDQTVARSIVRHAKQTDSWQQLGESTFVDNGNKRVFTIKGDYVLANYLSFVFPVSQSAQIYEVEVYPETEMRLKSYYIKDKWLTTDTEAFNVIDTRIETQQTFKYSEVGAPTPSQFAILPAAKLDGEMISVGGLRAGTAYEYKMTVSDYNGNMINLERRSFNTRPKHFALNVPS